MSFSQSFQVAAPADLGGQALDAAENSHLAAGTHIRIAPSPDLGLPVRPFDVVRMSLGPGAKWPGVRKDIEWRDNKDNLLTEPFTVVPGNPVRGYLPRVNGETCCWLQVRHSGFTLPTLPSVALRPAVAAPSIAITSRSSGDRSPVNVRAPTSRTDTRTSPTSTQLTIRACANTAMGPAVLAIRTQTPYEVAATPIEWIEISGSGKVEGVSWLETGAVLQELRRRLSLPAGDPNRIVDWRSLSLPVENSVRYDEAPPDALAQADARAKEAAPRRLGLHDEPAVSGPKASPGATPQDELRRLKDTTPKLSEYLQQLVDANNPSELSEEIPQGSGIEFIMPLLMAVEQSIADPGIAHWMGFAAVDQEPPSNKSGDLVAYGVVGTWLRHIEGEHPVRLATALCAVQGHPGNAPKGPLIGECIDRGFMPLTPPEARRAVEIPCENLVLGAGVAVARRVGDEVSGLNKRAPSGRAIPFWPCVPDEATTPDVSTVIDRKAPPEAFVYRVAQHDWFGRWSPWSEKEMAAAKRPSPPVPVVQATYAPPATLDAEGPLAGTITVTVPVPPVSSLSPGSHLLDHLALFIDGILHTFEVNQATEQALTRAITGPPIERAGQRTVTLVAHWLDKGGQSSDPSQPRKLVLNDPRPGPDVTFTPELRYTSRPDATGWAHYRLQWSSAPGQAYFRVFYTTETRLLDHLTQLSEGSAPGSGRAGQAIQAINNAADAAERALAYSDFSDLMARDLFELLTPEPIASPSNGAHMEYVHAVSSELQILSFYRVVSITRAQVESPFLSASLVPVRVPNTLRPARPVLTLSPTQAPESKAFLADLTVAVALGNIDAAEFRIRRAINGAFDINAMPVIATGQLQATPEGRREATLVDSGASPFGGALQPWVRYQWRAEVRGADEVGGGPGADWSEPSAPVGHMFVPPHPPAPPEIVSLTHTETDTTLRITHPDTLGGALARGYSIEIYRQRPGERAEMASAIPAAASTGGGGGGSEFVFVDGEENRPPQTAYRALVKDPLGRSSVATQPVFVPEVFNG